MIARFHSAGRVSGVDAGPPVARAGSGRVVPEYAQAWARAAAMVPAEPPRGLLIRALPWNEPERIDLPDGTAFREWWSRSSIDTDSGGVPLTLLHTSQGGREVGWVTELRDEEWGLIGVARVWDGPLGDGVLGLVDRNDKVPVSVAFEHRMGGRRLHEPSGGLPGVQRTRATLLEIAITPQGCYRNAYIVGRVPLRSTEETLSEIRVLNDAALVASGGGW